MAAHPELIGSNMFNEKFKNYLRDMYILQFKNKDTGFKKRAKNAPKGQGGSATFYKDNTDIPVTADDFSKDLPRIKKILEEKSEIEWKSFDGGKVECCSSDTRTLSENPFHALYQYGLYNRDFIIFFWIVILSLGKHCTLGEDFDLGNKTDLNNLEQLFPRFGQFSDRRTISNRINYLSELGILHAERGRTNFYSLSPVFLKDVAKDLNPDKFKEMLLFFSQTAPLGEIGAHLLKRSGLTESPFRFKHNYIAAALNDYNLIDILYATEHCMWLKIQHRSSIDLKHSELVCFPIGVRESTYDGRLYMLYYSPYMHSVSSMRVEFIDSIEFVIVEGSFDEEIKNARIAAEYAWGSAFLGFKAGNVKEPYPLTGFSFVIEYSPEEKHIYKRLLRECRHGKVSEPIMVDGNFRITFTAEVTDPGELIPWLRSFSQRIVSIKADKSPLNPTAPLVSETIKSDIFKSYENLCSQSGLDFTPQPPRFTVPDNVIKNTPLKVSLMPHNHLFNELYSYYFNKIGELVFECVKGGISLTTEEIREKAEDIVKESHFTSPKHHSSTAIKKKRNEIIDDITHILSVLKCLIPKGANSCLDESVWSHFDLIPLSKLEITWLSNVFESPKATLFFTKEEIGTAKARLPETDLFDINKVQFYDRHHTFYTPESLHDVLDTTLRAIRTKRSLEIFYKSEKGNESNRWVYPLFVEYSARDDRLRLNAADSSGLVSVFNMDNIISIKASETFKLPEKLITPKKLEAKLLFTDYKNVPDRILTEFSTNKKVCTKHNGAYTLELTYDENDSAEITVRLLSYMPYITVVPTSDKDPLFTELRRRLAKQLRIDHKEALSEKGVISYNELTKLIEEPTFKEQILSSGFSELESMLGPHFALMKDFDQNNPHHHLNLLEHTMEAFSYLLNSKSEDKTALLIASLFHDIGKPYVVQKKFDNYVFYNHAKESESIARLILSMMGCPGDISDRICFYVAHHDDFISFRAPDEPFDKNNKFLSPVTEKTVMKVISSAQKNASEKGGYIPTLKDFYNLTELCTADAFAQSEIAHAQNYTMTREMKMNRSELIREIIKSL